MLASELLKTTVTSIPTRASAKKRKLPVLNIYREHISYMRYSFSSLDSFTCFDMSATRLLIISLYVSLRGRLILEVTAANTLSTIDSSIRILEEDNGSGGESSFVIFLAHCIA